MPWKEICAMKLCQEFIRDYQKRILTVTALAKNYGISRKTAHKWIKRYKEEGEYGLRKRSHAPHSSPNASSEKICEKIIATKEKYSSWGPKKVLDLLRREYPMMHWPSDSTASEILKKAGLVKKRRYKRRVPPDVLIFSDICHSNECWSVDFKGDFKLGNGKRCYPLTITDNYSRFVLCCKAMHRISTQETIEEFRRVFKEYGLPARIRSDNGVPFASVGATGLTKLSKWFIDLGIRQERIRPGRPTQNGRHERMHRTLKDAVCKPAGYSLSQQQKMFDDFVYEYNFLRSHEALERHTPSDHYQKSSRRYPRKLNHIGYAENYLTRRVRQSGTIKWRAREVYVSMLLAKETVGLKQLDEFFWEIIYKSQILGHIDLRTMKIVNIGQWHSQVDQDLQT